MKRTCLKCNHVHPNATGDALEACPMCGAIYSRVEAAMAQRAEAAARPPAAPAQALAQRAVPPQPARPAPRASSSSEYVQQLRSQSIYPTFRSVVGVFAVVGYVLALVVALIAVLTIFKGSIGAGLLELAGALFILVITRMGKEMSLMVADASDALVRMAARSEGASEVRHG